MNRIAKIASLLLFSTCFIFVGCTKKGGEESVPPNAITQDSGDKDRLIVDTTVELPAALRNAAKKMELLIWDVKDNKGSIVAVGVLEVEKFPVRLQVKARDLMQPLDPESPLSVSVRMVKVGDEGKPPKKGQLVGFMGAASAKMHEEVVPEKISKKILDRVEKKLGLSDKFKNVAIGGSAKIVLQPYQF